MFSIHFPLPDIFAASPRPPLSSRPPPPSPPTHPTPPSQKQREGRVISAKFESDLGGFGAILNFHAHSELHRVYIRRLAGIRILPPEHFEIFTLHERGVRQYSQLFGVVFSAGHDLAGEARHGQHPGSPAAAVDHEHHEPHRDGGTVLGRCGWKPYYHPYRVFVSMDEPSRTCARVGPRRCVSSAGRVPRSGASPGCTELKLTGTEVDDIIRF